MEAREAGARGEYETDSDATGEIARVVLTDDLWAYMLILWPSYYVYEYLEFDTDSGPAKCGEVRERMRRDLAIPVNLGWVPVEVIV